MMKTTFYPLAFQAEGVLSLPSVRICKLYLVRTITHNSQIWAGTIKFASYMHPGILAAGFEKGGHVAVDKLISWCLLHGWGSFHVTQDDWEKMWNHCAMRGHKTQMRVNVESGNVLTARSFGLTPLWHHDMETLSTLLAPLRRILRSQVSSHYKGRVMRNYDIFIVVCMKNAVKTTV